MAGKKGKDVKKILLLKYILQLNYKTLDDWYLVKASDIREYGGRGLLNFYKNSHINTVCSVFPEHDWKVYLAIETLLIFYKDMEI